MGNEHMRHVKVVAIMGFLVSMFAIFCLYFKAFNIDGRVVLAANFLLMGILYFNIIRHAKSANNANPHAMVRGVMSGVVLKLFVLGGAAFIYLYAAGEKRNTNALFISMALYIVYTWFEVKIVSSIKKKTDA